MTPSSSQSPERFSMGRERLAVVCLTVISLFTAFLPIGARAQTAANPMAAAPKSSSTSKLGPPTIPIDQIIQKFATAEQEFKTERDNYTYTQTFLVQTLDDSDRVDGEYRMTSDIVFDGKGRRIEKVTNAPTPTLQRIDLTQEDFDDLEHLYPFSLTTEDLPKYDIKYVDHVALDDLNTYIFEVSPKSLEKGQRYFEGRIWVDDKDLQIVKTLGRPVGYVKKRKNGDDAFPVFETFRENIEGKYWFPTYTRANENLQFKHADTVHIRISVRYEDYKRFGVTVKIGKPVDTEKQ